MLNPSRSEEKNGFFRTYQVIENAQFTAQERLLSASLGFLLAEITESRGRTVGG